VGFDTIEEAAVVVRGRIQNGVVVLSETAKFQEGQEVAVIATGQAQTGDADASPKGHKILEIPVVSLGNVLRPVTPEDDLLGEMLDEGQ
jgi:hypothetical protein